MFTDLDLFEENYFSLVYLTMFTSTSIKNISVSEDYKSDFPLKQYLLLMLIGLVEQSHLKQYTDKTNLLYVISSIPYIKSIYFQSSVYIPSPFFPDSNNNLEYI